MFTNYSPSWQHRLPQAVKGRRLSLRAQCESHATPAAAAHGRSRSKTRSPSPVSAPLDRPRPASHHGPLGTVQASIAVHSANSVHGATCWLSDPALHSYGRSKVDASGVAACAGSLIMTSSPRCSMPDSCADGGSPGGLRQGNPGGASAELLGPLRRRSSLGTLLVHGRR